MPKSPAAAEWARCRPWIEAALAYCGGTHLIEDVEAQIACGEAQFWPGEKSAVVTEVLTFPRLTVLHFWLCGGDLKELTRDMRPVIEAWGESQGATRFTTAGRHGWQRVMKRYGFEPIWNVCVKDVQ